MSTIHVWSRAQAESLRCPNDAQGLMISIFTEGDQPAQISPTFRKVLFLEFVDAAPAEKEVKDGRWNDGAGGKDWKVFDEDQAWQIAGFLLDHQEGEDIHIHCDAGWSRSVAVGMVLSEHLGFPLELHAHHDTQFANGLVKSILRRVLRGLQGS